MISSYWVSISTLATLIVVAAAERVPREIGWADDVVGPDGPWRAAKVLVGAEAEEIALYPGGAWETWLIEDDYCDDDFCYASKAGTYDRTSGSTGGIGLDGGLDGFMLGLDLEGGKGTRYIDDVALNDMIRAENVSLVLLNNQKIQYPGGRKSPFFAGCLSLGANRETKQSFGLGDDIPPINASVVPGWLWENEWTPSNSFGMHIGAVEPAMPGSLWLGGYDQNRVVGDILSMSGGPRDGITLRDISIEVVGGKSPFEFESKDDLLAKGNSSIVNGLGVSIDGCSPYLTLPKSTCDNLAASLPVKFDEDLGLYLWDTKSDKYKKIIGSASALTFSFIAGSNTDTLKIRVPFMHLNLTLSMPLVDTPTPYFPCHVNDKGRYVLGRAFLQDAFIGANWHRDANTWWLAQAPGRNIQATTNIVSIEEKDKTISKGGNDWEASWNGVWDNSAPTSSAPPSNSASGLPSDEGSSSGSSNPKDSEGASNNESTNSGLSTGAKAGIGAGIGGAVLAFALGAFFLLRRRQKNKSAMETTQVSYTQAPYSGAPYSSHGQYTPAGFPITPWKPPHDETPPQEMPSHVEAQSTIYHEVGPGEPRYLNGTSR